MINILDALGAVAKHRGNAVVVASESSRVPWMQVSQNPDLDIPFAGCMSKESSVGLGIALSHPERKVIVFSGDGELLMNLGTLVTVANQAPPNFYHFVIENEVYATTGGQPVPGAGRVDFAGLARDAGYAATYDFDNLEELDTSVEEILNQKGPVFIRLHIKPEIETRPIGERPRSWRPLRESMRTVQAALCKCPGGIK